MLSLDYSFGIWSVSEETQIVQSDKDLIRLLTWVKGQKYKVEEVKINTYLYDAQTYDDLLETIDSAMKILWKNCYKGDSVKVELVLKYCPEGS